MEPTEGARTFLLSGEAYDGFMGRYSRPLARVFVDASDVVGAQRVLDVGCGPGALTGELVSRLGSDAVFAVDPSPPFAAACRERHPGVDVRTGRAEELPFETDSFDIALSQLVFHFVSDPDAVVAELGRVVRPGGSVGACVWDFDEGMEMLRTFWDAALDVDPTAPDEARTLRFSREGEIAELLNDAGFESVTERTLTCSSRYASFDELWEGFLAGIGPAGSYCVSLSLDDRAAVRAAMFERLGSPSGPLTLGAVARSAHATIPR